MRRILSRDKVLRIFGKPRHQLHALSVLPHPLSVVYMAFVATRLPRKESAATWAICVRGCEGVRLREASKWLALRSLCISVGGGEEIELICPHTCKCWLALARLLLRDVSLVPSGSMPV